MAVTLDQLESWRPERLGSLGDELNADRKKLLDLQDEMDAAAPPASWIGDAAVAAGDTHTDLVADLNDVVAGISPVIEALDTASAAITSARDRALAARAQVRSNGWELEISGTSVRVTDPNPEPEGEGLLAAVDETLMETLAQNIADALGDADRADADLAAVLRSSTRGEYDGGTGSLADAALPEGLRGLSDSELIREFLDHPSEYNSYVDALSTEQQQALGRAIADRAEPLADHDLAVDNATGDTAWPTDEQVADLSELLDAYGGDSTVSTALLEDLGPENLLDIQQTFASRPASDTGSEPLSDDVLGDAQRAWGGVLASATAGTTSDTDAGTSENVSGAWVEELLDRGDDEYTLDLYGDQARGFQILSPLLHDPSHGSYFLNEVGDRMESFEEDYREENDASPWVTDSEHQIDFTDGSWERTGEGDLEDDELPPGRDPFGPFMDGLAQNPEAARQFFSTNPNDVGDGEELDRVDHYLRDREWPLPRWAEGTSDAQSYFGDALVAATTHDATPLSVQIAEHAVTVGADGDLPSDVLRRSYADILAAYTPDVFTEFGNGEPVSTGDALPWIAGDQDAGLRADFDDSELRSLLRDVGQDEEAVDTVTGAATAYANYGYDHYFSGAADGPPDPAESRDDVWEQRREGAVSNVNSPYADVIGALGEGASENLREEGFAADAEQSGAGDGKYQVGGYLAQQLAGQVPFVGGPLSDAVGAGADGLAGMNDVDTSAQVREDIAEGVAGTRGAAQALAEDAVYRNLPADVLGDTFLDSDGERIPMADWEQEQIDEWQRVRTETGAGGAASQLSQDLVDQLEGSRGDTEDNEGE